MPSKIEIVEVFSGVTSGPTIVSKEIVSNVQVRFGGREKQILNAIRKALYKAYRRRFFTTSAFLQDPENPAHKWPHQILGEGLQGAKNYFGYCSEGKFRQLFKSEDFK